MSAWILKLGFSVARRFLNSAFSARSWMSASCVARASQLVMADESMRQSMKSGRFFLSLKAVSSISLSCVAIVWISSL